MPFQPDTTRPNSPLLSRHPTTAPSSDNEDNDFTHHHDDPRGRKTHHSLLQPSSYAGPSGLLRSRSPSPSPYVTSGEARKRYTLAAIFLIVSLVSFTVQTELAAHIQHVLGWDKAYCMLYMTHSSWTLLWPLQGFILWFMSSGSGGTAGASGVTRPGGGRTGRDSVVGRRKRWGLFWREQVREVRRMAVVIQNKGKATARRGAAVVQQQNPWAYLAVTTVGVTTALTVAGLSWYLAVSMTTPSDLTAIYNCSAFFAYAFSVPLLKERLKLDKMLAVAVAITGVLVVAYGPSTSSDTSSTADNSPSTTPDPATRLAGNLIIGAGSILYGLYEVLYKRLACPPDGAVSSARGVQFANAFASMVGLFTLLVLWIPLPILHILGWEEFELPTGKTAWLLLFSILMNMMFSGSFLVLISLTSPVLSSVAALLTIFIVAIVDWLWAGTPLSVAAVVGGLLIIAAFGMLSWSTWKEMSEEERKKSVDSSEDEDD